MGLWLFPLSCFSPPPPLLLSPLSQCTARELLPGALWGTARLWPDVAAHRTASLLPVPAVPVSALLASIDVAATGHHRPPPVSPLVAAVVLMLDAAVPLLPRAQPQELSAAAWAAAELFTPSSSSSSSLAAAASSSWGPGPSAARRFGLAPLGRFCGALGSALVSAADSLGPQALATVTHSLSLLGHHDGATLSALLGRTEQLWSHGEMGGYRGVGGARVDGGGPYVGARTVPPLMLRDMALVAAALAQLRCAGLGPLLARLGRTELKAAAAAAAAIPRCSNTTAAGLFPHQRELFTLAWAHAVADVHEGWMAELVVRALLAAEPGGEEGGGGGAGRSSGADRLHPLCR